MPGKGRAARTKGSCPLIGFDNERGKGDHWHRGDHEHTYRFIDIDRLIDDFIAEVAAWRDAH